MYVPEEEEWRSGNIKYKHVSLQAENRFMWDHKSALERHNPLLDHG